MLSRIEQEKSIITLGQSFQSRNALFAMEGDLHSSGSIITTDLFLRKSGEP